MIRLLLPAIFAGCLSIAANSTPADPNSALITNIEAIVNLPIDNNENNELVHYLAALLQNKADSHALALARNRLEILKIYKKISCDFKSHSGQTTLLCQLERIPIIRKIIIQNLPVILLEKDLRKRLSIETGEPFDIDTTDSDIQMYQIQKTVTSFLERQGYFDAKVTVDYKSIINTSTLDILINIETGSFRRVNRVTLSPSITFEQAKIRGMFQNMCRYFRYTFEAIGMGGFNCYSRERERDTIQDLQILLDEKGYNTASILTQKTILDPLDSNTPKKCRATRQDLNKLKKNGIKPPSRCLNMHVTVDLGPQIITEFVFDKAQTLTLSPTEIFFRNFFTVEFFSRFLNASFTGASWPADETILVNELRNALTFSTSHKIDEKEIAYSVENIKSILAKRGYTLANVKTEQDNIHDKIISIKFFIMAKNPLAVTKIFFVGDPIFSNHKILKEVSLSLLPRSAFHSGHFNNVLLAADTEKIKYFYINRGYHDVQIKTESRVETDGVHIWYQIIPGQKYTIQELVIENSHPELLPQILPLLSNCQQAKNSPIKPLKSTDICTKSPYLPQFIVDDENRILDVYRSNGYLHTKVKTKVVKNGFNALLVFYLNPPEENQQTYVKGILIDGNTVTRSSAMIRQLGTPLFLPDTILNLPKLEEGVARLRQTNLYSRINYRYLNENKDSTYILLSVVEKPSLTIDLSLSFSTDNLFSLGGEIHESNLFGNMLQLTSEIDLGLFWGRKSNIKNTFRWPWIYGLPLNFELVVPQIIYTKNPTRDPPERHLLAQVIASLEWQLSSTLYPYMKYETRWDKWQQQYEPSQSNPNFINIFKNWDGLLFVWEESATVRSVLTPGVNYMNVDHPFNPKRGLKLNLSTDLSFSLLGAQIPFQIVNAQMAHYFTAGPFTFASQLIFRRAFIENPDSTWWVLKYQSDMDSIGGDRSVRGYQPGTIGIWGPMLNNRDGKILLDKDNNPVMGYHPGNLSLQGNLEIRFPIKKSFLIGDLDGAIFTDFAFIDNCKTLFSCNNLNSVWEQYNTSSQIGWSVGLGLRYVLPIGPISLDYAISPIKHAPNWIGRESRIHLLFGYSF